MLLRGGILTWFRHPSTAFSTIRGHMRPTAPGQSALARAAKNALAASMTIPDSFMCIMTTREMRQ